MFEVKIKYEKTQDGGKVKRVTETYLLDALSYTEAEAKITDQMLPYISGEYEIANIRRAPYQEIQTNDNGGYFYKARVLIITTTDSGGIKTSPRSILFNADDYKAAGPRLTEVMAGTMIDYRVTGITETSILDVFK
jgi:hypothetical protein